MRGFMSSPFRVLVLTLAILFFAAPSELRAEDPGVMVIEEETPQEPVRKLSRLSKPCMRCHSMETLAYRDLRTGEFKNLWVDKKAYLESNHGQMDCFQCHRRRYYKTSPHRASSRQTALHCFDCHKGGENDKFADRRYDFDRIDKQFRHSVHYKALPKTFNCFSCHDPHQFEVAYKKKTAREVIKQDNGFCLKCHATRTKFSALTKREFPELRRTHRWLPNAEQHWRAVRCIECHTPHEGRISHVIVGAEKAERNCVACHSKDSVLLTQLYQFKVSEQREKAGMLGTLTSSQSYVIGRNRSRVLDNTTVILIGLTLLGISGHAIARFITGMRRR